MTTTSREGGELFGPRFELFADVLALGTAMAVASLPLVTAPTALSVGCEVLRRRQAHGEPAGVGRYATALVARLRAAPGRELAAGAALVGAAVLVLADLLLAGAGLPGAGAFAVLLAGITAVSLVVALRAAAHPVAAHGWRRALREAATRTAGDPSGSGLVLLALATAVLCGWTLPPSLFLVPGPLALALIAVEGRLEGDRR